MNMHFVIELIRLDGAKELKDCVISQRLSFYSTTQPKKGNKGKDIYW
jgi:hypothetical protein